MVMVNRTNIYDVDKDGNQKTTITQEFYGYDNILAGLDAIKVLLTNKDLGRAVVFY